MNTKKWYTSNKTGAQPIIIDEQTGATIAVCYQDKDGNQLEHATLIAQAPKLLETIETMHSILSNWNKDGKYKNEIDYLERAIHEAKGY